MISPAHQPRRLPVVGVMGSGTRSHRRWAGRVGRWLAKAGVHLLTGGGEGVMHTVSEAFFKVRPRKGLVIGILPGARGEPASPPPGYPNPWVEIPVYTHLPLSGSEGMHVASRNHINILSSTAIVALPGSAGTASEVRLALRYQRPVAAFLKAPGDIPDLPSTVMVTDDFNRLKKWVLSRIEAHR